MSSFSISVPVMFDNDGQVDDQATLTGFQSTLAQYKAERETEEATIAAEVHRVFDQHTGYIGMPFLVNTAVSALNPQNGNFAILKAKVEAYIHDNSDRMQKKDRKSGEITQEAEPPRTRTFGIRKGAGGGVCRWSDMPQK